MLNDARTEFTTRKSPDEDPPLPDWVTTGIAFMMWTRELDRMERLLRWFRTIRPGRRVCAV